LIHERESDEAASETKGRVLEIAGTKAKGRVQVGSRKKYARKSPTDASSPDLRPNWRNTNCSSEGDMHRRVFGQPLWQLSQGVLAFLLFRTG
jgi:hypothetical protein